MSDTARNPLREVSSWVRAVARVANPVAAGSLVMAGLVAVTAPPASAATGAGTTIPIFVDAGVVTGTPGTSTGVVTYPTLQNLSATMTVTPNNPGSGIFDGAWCMKLNPCGYWGGVNTYAPESPFTPSSVENTNGITVFFAAYGNGTTKPPSACSNLPTALAPNGSPGDNFNCGQVATVTFTFNRPITDPVMQLFNLGGNRGYGAFGVSAYSNWTVTSGQTLTLDDSLGNIMLDDSRIQVITPSNSLSMSPSGTGAGSFTVHGTFTTLAFNVGMNLQNQDPGGPMNLNPADAGLEFVPEAVAFQFSTSGTATIYDYSWTTSPNTPVSKNLNEANSPGLVYTTTPVTPPANGQVVLNANGTYTYTPNNGFYGTDSFAYQGCSTASPPQCATRTVTITVPSPAPPGPPVSVLAVSDDYTTPMNTPMTKGDAAAKDVADGTTLAGATWRPLDAPAHGTVSGWDNATGRFTYTPDKDWYGTDSFRYTVCLAPPYDAVCSTATETITALPTITAVDDKYATSMNTAMTAGNARAGDTSVVPGGIAGSTVTQTSQPAHGTVTWNPANDGTFTYTPDRDWYGTDSFTYQICLPKPYETVCSSATETITVTPPITAVDDSYSTPANTPMTKGNASKGDSSPLGLSGATWKKTSSPAHGKVSGWDPTTGRFTYTPDKNWSGTDSFTYRVCLAPPNQAVCATATEYIAVSPVTPSGKPAAAPLRKNLGVWQMAKPYTFGALKKFTPALGAKAVTSSLAIAPMGTSAWGKRVEVPGKGIFALAGNGKVTYTGPTCYSGNVTVRYRAQDSTGQWADSTLTIKVANPGGKEICRL